MCVCVRVCECMYFSIQNTQAVTAHILPTLNRWFISCVILGNAFNLTGNGKISKVHKATDEATVQNMCAWPRVYNKYKNPFPVLFLSHFTHTTFKFKIKICLLSL